MNDDRRRRAAAARQAAYRRRRAAGTIIVPVEINAAIAAEQLIEAGLLAEWDYNDPKAIAAALEKAVVRIIAEERDA